MFHKIMVPVDLAHAHQLEAALAAAADLARHWGATCVYVGVTAATPGPVAHSPAEFTRKLEAFASDEAARRGHRAEARTMVSHDPAVDLDSTLLKAVDEIGADLVVMAAHVPGMADMLVPHHGGKLAQHAKISVFLVRAP